MSADTLLREEVQAALLTRPRRLPCKLFYDERGCEIYGRICELEDYYPTRTELQILRDHAGDIGARLPAGAVVVEPGSGSGEKLRLFLSHLREIVRYVPVDISQEFLDLTASRLAASMPALEVRPLCADFAAGLAEPPNLPAGCPRVVFFPGSTIGNFHPRDAARFLAGIGAWASHVVVGVDLQKAPAILERAYDDREGVTAEFNLNILRHVNRLLGADFDVERFSHRAHYNRDEGRIEMHLVSTCAQDVRIGDDTLVHLEEGETIHTENSYKYSRDGFTELARSAGLEVEGFWTDEREWFGVFLLRR